jgi:hypothetical protein
MTKKRSNMPVKTKKAAPKTARNAPRPAARPVAAPAVRTATLETGRAAINDRRPNWFVRNVRRVWNWIRGLDIIALLNIILLLAIIILFLGLIGRTLKLTECMRTPVASPPAATRTVAQRPTVIVARNADTTQRVKSNEPVFLPIPKKAETVGTPAGTPRAKVGGNAMISGNRYGEKLAAGTWVTGDLVIENMRQYTLPCGVRIDGNIIVRNVKLLKFCGGFELIGDMYVSSNSSFGPIPRNAKMNGRVVL